MRKYSGITLLLCAVYITTLGAQPVIQTTDIPTEPGTTIHNMQTPGLVSVDLGPSGANQTWDFSAMEAIEPWILEWVNPAGTPFASDFPSSNRCWQHLDPGIADVYTYYTITTPNFLWDGQGTVSPDTSYTVYINHTQLANNYPMNYGDTWLSVYEMDMGVPGMINVDSTWGSVDGWGTLVDITGSAQCLRVQNHKISWVLMMGIPVLSTESWRYEWIVPGGIPGVSISSDIDETNPNFTVGTFSRITEITTGVKELLNRAYMPAIVTLEPAFPNPFNPETNLTFRLPMAGKAFLAVYDIRGNEVTRLHNGWLPPGVYQTTFTGSELSSGMYFARLTAGNFQKMQKLILIK